MNKFLWSSSFAMATAAFLAACGDETTNVTETKDPTSVAKFKDLAKCTDENEGDLVYVKDSAAAYLCSDNVWNVLNASAVNGSNGKDGADGKNGKNGTDGKNGTNGTDGKNGEDGNDGKDGASCSATVKKDNSGFELTCGGKVIGTISNGTNGTNGLKGENGKSCEGKANEDGSVTISCDGKEVATLKNGANGKSAYERSGSKLSLEKWLDSLSGAKGKDCVAKSVEGGVEITCGDSEPVKISDGTNGTDGTVEACTIAGDKDGVVTLECGEGENAKVQLYKAMCGDNPYEPETHFCYYNGEERAFSVLELCGKKTYVPGKDLCENGRVQKFCYVDCPKGECTIYRYDEETQFCRNSQVLDFCNGTDYDPDQYKCVENKLKEKTFCGVQDYDPETHFCYYDEKYETYSVHELCGGKTYVPGEDICDDGKVLKICYKECSDGELGECKYYGYDEETQFCAMKGTTVMGAYKKVTIGTGENAQTWMAENLNYETTEGSYCYGETEEDPKTENCTKYGRLYTWAAANAACPDDWHLPSKAEFEKLIVNVDPSSGDSYIASNKAGPALKDPVNWNGDETAATVGFLALPAGYYYDGNKSFLNEGNNARFWSSTAGDNPSTFYYMSLFSNNTTFAFARMLFVDEKDAYSVRCIKD